MAGSRSPGHVIHSPFCVGHGKLGLQEQNRVLGALSTQIDSLKVQMIDHGLSTLETLRDGLCLALQNLEGCSVWCCLRARCLGVQLLPAAFLPHNPVIS